MEHQQEYRSEYQQEYQEELQKIHDRDFTHNWVSSSAFIFYLSVFCILALLLGMCTKLYQNRYEQPEIAVPESTKYTPQYK